MTIGLSTYAFFWQASDRVEKPLDLTDMLAATADHGVGVFQICDYPAVAELDPDQLRTLSAQAERAGIRLELGTRGVGPQELTRYLDLAQALDATTVRSMLYTATHRPTPDEAVALLRQAIPAFEQRRREPGPGDLRAGPHPGAGRRGPAGSTAPTWASAPTRPTASPPSSFPSTSSTRSRRTC